MIRTILTSVLVGAVAYAHDARASVEHASGASPAVASSQDFESYVWQQPGIHEEKESGRSYWAAPDDETLVSTSIGAEEENKYLEVVASEHPYEGLLRTWAPRAEYTNAVHDATNVLSGGCSGLNYKFRMQPPLYDADCAPEVDGYDRLVLWAQHDADDESAPGALYVSAGRYVGSLRNPVRHDYRIAGVSVETNTWYEIAIRSIPDFTQGGKALGFELWINGNPVAGADDYSIAEGFSIEDNLTTEARALVTSRRLFPSLTKPGADLSLAMAGLGFTGIGSIDDVTLATNAPASYVKSPRTLTLEWDVGVSKISYRVGDGAEVELPSDTVRYHSTVIAIPEAGGDVTVKAEYDTANKFSEGLWAAAGACQFVTNIVGDVTNRAFRCDASAAACTGKVRSYRNETGLGGDTSFAVAKEQAIARGATLVLSGDFAATDADEGRIAVELGETLTIDLNGHSLTNAVGEYPTVQNYGTLTIIDSVGGGKVVPYAPFTGDTNDFHQIAVQNYASTHAQPTLNIKGGVYDGFIKNSGVVTNHATVMRMEGKFVIERNINELSEPKFLLPGGDEFVYERHLEDRTLYYGYEEPYWQPYTNAFIWCGLGTNDLWKTPENWRCNAVPGSKDLAIFPAVAGTNAWEADMETGIEVRNLWFAGDTILHGASDFTDVNWKTDLDGRVRGDATLTWSGKLPPSLSTLLDPLWAGTVAIVDVGNMSPKALKDLASWGTGSSTVRFQGVRGYYPLTSSLTVSYTLELVDGSNGYAWKNDAGFTGAVLDFPVLSGSGTFESSRNTIANRQIIGFHDIYGFTGTMDVKGKRVVLGTGDVATTEAGSITWSKGMKLKSGFCPSCKVAAFGGSMDFSGAYNTKIADYSDSTVGAESEVVNMTQFGEVGELCVTNPVKEVWIVAWSDDAILVDGRRVVTNQLSKITTKSAIMATKSALAGLKTSKYYRLSSAGAGGLETVTVELSEQAVPVIGPVGDDGESSAALTIENGVATIKVSNAIVGFWYAMEYKAEMEDAWQQSGKWIDATISGEVELTAPATGVSGFYRVVVTDVDPEEETK